MAGLKRTRSRVLLKHDELVFEPDDVVSEAAWLGIGRRARFDGGQVLRDDVALAGLGGDFADADEGAFEDFVGLAHDADECERVMGCFDECERAVGVFFPQALLWERFSSSNRYSAPSALKPG